MSTYFHDDIFPSSETTARFSFLFNDTYSSNYHVSTFHDNYRSYYINLATSAVGYQKYYSEKVS